MEAAKQVIEGGMRAALAGPAEDRLLEARVAQGSELDPWEVDCRSLLSILSGAEFNIKGGEVQAAEALLEGMRPKNENGLQRGAGEHEYEVWRGLCEAVKGFVGEIGIRELIRG